MENFTLPLCWNPEYATALPSHLLFAVVTMVLITKELGERLLSEFLYCGWSCLDDGE